MIQIIKKLVSENKKTLIGLATILLLISIFGYIFKDIIGIVATILFIIIMFNLENISTYFQNVLAEKKQQKAEMAQNVQIIHDILTDVMFHGLTGQLGKILGAIPPGTVMDVFPASIPPVWTFHGRTTYRFTFSRTSGSQPITEDVIKQVANSYLRKVTSGLLLPEPDSTFLPYFYVLNVVSDTCLPDTFNICILYVENVATDEYLSNCIREEAEEHRRKLVDSQPPDDEEF